MATVTVRYRDPTPLTDAEKSDIQGLAGAIRTKMYGLDVREAIASSLEKISSDKSTYVSTPKGVYVDSAALKNAFPNGTTGVYITRNTGHWWVYDYENGDWVDGGPYQSAGISEDNAEDVNDILSRKYDGQRKQVISAINSQGYEATDGLWVNNRKFAPTHVKSIEFYSKQKTAAKIYIFVETGYGSSVQVWDIIDAGTSTVGINNIVYDKDVPANFYVGVMNVGLAYDNAESKYNYLHFDSSKLPVKGVAFNPEFKGTKVGLAISVYTAPEETSWNNVDAKFLRTIDIISHNKPSYSDDPSIVFDFVNGSVKLTNLYAIGDNAGLKNINGEYTLPQLPTTSNGKAVNYVLVYDYKDNKAKVLMGNDSINFNQDFARNLMICGFTIWGLNPERRYSVTIWSPNRDYLTLIMQKPVDETFGVQTDVINSQIIDSGIWHYTYAALGDSITRGENPLDEYKPMIGHRYTDYVSEHLGMIALNYGVGGTTIANHNENSMVNRIDKIGYYDILSLFGGTNDYNSGVELGKPEDGDMTHFIPAFESIVQKAMEKDGLFFIITPTKRETGNTDNKAGLTLEDYVQAEIDIAQKYGVPVLDLYHTFQFNAFSSQTYKAKYMSDGVHPTPAGADKLAPRVARFINNLLTIK